MDVCVAHKDGVTLAVAEDVFLALWAAPATVQRIDWVTAFLASRIELGDGSLRACQFLLPTASPPGIREVPAILRGVRCIVPRTRVLVTVALGDLRFADLVVSVLTLGTRLTGVARQVVVCRSFADAFECMEAAPTDGVPRTMDTRAANGWGRLERAQMENLSERLFLEGRAENWLKPAPAHLA